VEGKIDLFMSQEILDEIVGVMKRPRFRRTSAQVAEAKQLIEEMTLRVAPTVRLAVVKDDPTDNKILECAVEAGADVVSGDKYLLKLKECAGMPIVKIAEFLRGHVRER
jgi:putative PIN family toxin of toxin-antitoxin system